MELDVSQPLEGASGANLRLLAARYRWAAAPLAVAFVVFPRRQGGRLARVPVGARVGALGAECDPARGPPARAARSLVALPRGGPAVSICWRSCPTSRSTRSAIQYFANCAEAVIGALALLHLCPFPRRFDRLRTVLVLVLLAGVIAPLVTSLLMVGAFALAGIPADFWLTVIVRTITNTFAIVALVPLIVHGVAGLRSGPRDVPLTRVAEGVDPRDHAGGGLRRRRSPCPLGNRRAQRRSSLRRCRSSPGRPSVSACRALQRRAPRRRHLDLGRAERSWAFRRREPDRERALDRRVSRRHLRDLRTLRGAARGMAAHGDGAHARRGPAFSRARLAARPDRRARPRRHDHRGQRVLAAAPSNSRTRRASIASWRAKATSMPARAPRNPAAGPPRTSSRRCATCSRAAKRAATSSTRSRPAWNRPGSKCRSRSSGAPEGGAVVTRTDVTARKRAEREARNQQQQLTHLGRAAVLGQLSGASPTS